jgi:hypothetical protein
LSQLANLEKQPMQQQEQLVLDRERIENGRRYEPHYHSGRWRKVPVDWRFPRCGVADLWRQWWIGDSRRRIPPLSKLERLDVDFLDRLRISEEEKHGRTGKHKENRRPSRKSLGDMHWLMKCVKGKVIERNALEAEITLSNVDKMYAAVVDCFNNKARDSQKQWSSVVVWLRKETKNGTW